MRTNFCRGVDAADDPFERSWGQVIVADWIAIVVSGVADAREGTGLTSASWRYFAIRLSETILYEVQ